MKQLTLIISLLFALVSGNGILKATPLTAPADTLVRYYINGQLVDHFDGSQLMGKTITSYQIERFNHPEQGPVRVHNIQTSDAPQPPQSSQPTIRIRTVGDAQQADPVIVIDGKQVTKKEFEALDPTRIKSMTVIKNGSQEEVKKYKGWENGVILVETEKDGDN